MKTQVARNWRLGRTELQVSPQRGETLDVPGANWLVATQTDLLLRVDFDPDRARSGRLQLAYDITGLRSLKRCLAQVWTQERYYAVLEGIERVATECASGTRLIERILFDADHVYLTESGEPRFAYVPLDGVAYDATQNSPLLVLAALAGRRLRFDSAAGTVTSANLRKFVLSKEVFSLNVYRGFLDAEFADLRRATPDAPALWGLEDQEPGAGQVAYLDELFSSFGSGQEAGA